MGKQSFLQKIFSFGGFDKKFLSGNPQVRPAKNLIGVVTDMDNQLTSMLNRDSCNNEDALKRLYGASPTVYACVQRYLFALSPIRWEIKRRIKDNKFEPVENHEIERLLAYPNPHMGGGELNRRLTQHLLGCGNAYHRKIRGFNGKSIQMIWPVMPTCVEPIPDPTTFLRGYKVEDNNNSVDVSAEDMIHYQLEDPTNFYEGIGVVQANAKTIDSDSHAQDFWYNSIKKSIRKSGILSFKHDFSAEEAEDLEKKIREEVIGSWNAGGILMLGQEHTWTDLAKNAQDVDFVKARAMLREFIAAVFSVPAPMVGILDNSTYNNIQMARMIFWLDTLLPFLQNIAETMTRSFFFMELKGDQRYEYVVDYDVSSVEALYYVFGQKLDLALKLFKMGVETREIVKALGLPINENSVPAVGFLPQTTSTVDAVIELGKLAGQVPATDPNTRNKPSASEESRQVPKREDVSSDIHKWRSLWPDGLGGQGSEFE